MAHDVFISHARSDKPIADAVCATLEQAGIRCWIAPRDIQPGADWGNAIMQGLKGSQAFVLVLSRSANASPHITREVERAVHQGIPVIPLRVEDVVPEGALEYHLGTVHWLDAMTPPLEAHLKRLSDTLSAVLGVAAPPAAKPMPAAPMPVALPMPAVPPPEPKPFQAEPKPFQESLSTQVSADEDLDDEAVEPRRSFTSLVDVERNGPGTLLAVAWFIAALVDLVLVGAAFDTSFQTLFVSAGAALISAVVFGGALIVTRSDSALFVMFGLLDLVAVGAVLAAAGWPMPETARHVGRDLAVLLGLLLAVRVSGLRLWPMMLLPALMRAAAAYLTDVRVGWSPLPNPSDWPSTVLAAFATGLVGGAMIWKALLERQSDAIDSSIASEADTPQS